MRSNNSNPGTEQGKAVQLSQRRTWTWIERMLLVTGLALIVIYGAARIESSLRSKAAIEQFNAAISKPALNSPSGAASSEMERPVSVSQGVDFSLWSANRIEAYQKDWRGSSTPLAVLEISKIDLEVPVFEGTDGLTLNHGAGLIAGTAEPGEWGNVGIAAHRDGFFRGLKRLKNGDQIQLRTHAGTQLYVVDQIQIVQPNDVSVLQARSRPSLTLVTCYPFYFIGSAPQRYIVSASLMEKPEGHAVAVEVGTRFAQFTQKGERQ